MLEGKLGKEFESGVKLKKSPEETIGELIKGGCKEVSSKTETEC